MFGLIHRGELPGAVETEFEHLTARLKNLWLVEHNEDGTHRTESLTFAAADHTHEAADIISGTLDVARIPDLDAAKITTGALAKARQHAQTAYLDAAQTFSLKQTLSVAPELTLGFTERGRSVAAGEWINVVFNAGNFSSNAGTWTVSSDDQITFAYTLIGKTIIVSFVIATTDLSVSTASELTITVPGGYTSNRRMDARLAVATEAGTPTGAFIYINAGATELRLAKDSGSWAIGAIAVTGQIAFEVQ